MGAEKVNEAIDVYSDWAKPLHRMIHANGEEMLQLAQLRDALLPKLMSGGTDVLKVDLLAEQVGTSVSFMRLFVQSREHGFRRIVAVSLDLPRHNGASLLHRLLGCDVVARLADVEGQPAFHDGLVQEHVDGLGQRKAEAIEEGFRLALDLRIDSHADRCRFCHSDHLDKTCSNVKQL